MKRSVFGVTAFGCAVVIATQVGATDKPLSYQKANEPLQAAFAPWDDVEELISQAISKARKQVLVQAYLLSSKRITDTLIQAHYRGLDVRVLLDADQISNTSSVKVRELRAAGIPVWVETKYQHAHNKIIVLDASTKDATIITGSYNFTWSGQRRNAENILIVRQNSSLAAKYVLNWERHRQEATPYRK